MNIKDKIEEEKELAETILRALSLKAGITNKQIAYFYVFESIYGQFSEELESLANRFLRLQGYDIELLRSKTETEIFVQIYPVKNDRVLMVFCAY